MLVLDQGYSYELEGLINKDNTQLLNFVKKMTKGDYVKQLEDVGNSPERIDDLLKQAKAFDAEDDALIIVQDGVTNEEILEVLIHRMKVLNKKKFCYENNEVIVKLKEAKMWYESRNEFKKVKRNDNRN